MNDTSIHTKKDSHFDSIKEGGNDQYPLVAIVILNWNGKAFLNKFLPSVLESTYKNKRIILLKKNKKITLLFVLFFIKKIKSLIILKN